MSVAFLPENNQAPELKTIFETGAVRSADRAKERYDLISPIGLRRVAQTYHEGAAKYEDFNWEKGMPISDMLNHAIPHIYAYLAGDRSEDHLAHAAWNLLAALHSEELWPELNKNLRPVDGKLATHVAEKHHEASKAPDDNAVVITEYDPSTHTATHTVTANYDPTEPLQKASPETEAMLKAQQNQWPPKACFQPGVYQLFGGSHQYNGEIRYIDESGVVYLFENDLMRKVGGVDGTAYRDVTYDYICSTIKEFNNKGLPTQLKTLVDKYQSSPENVEIIN